jgi:recombination protein RecR
VLKGTVKEIIMAISPTIEGETTIYYISRKLADTGVGVSTIARGVSFGGDLEYADELTLGRSIVTRIPYAAK